MYCRKCGKQIDYDALICKECENAEMFFGGTEPETYVQPVTDRKEGFGRALTATIVGSISFFLSLIAMSIATVALEGYANGSYYGYSGGGISAASIILSFLCLGGAIPSLILGIKSIKCFICAKNEGLVKPVPTLVCGIIGVVMSAMTFVYVLLTFFMCALI